MKTLNFQRRKTGGSPRGDDDFPDIEIASGIGPQAVGGDKITGQYFLLGADFELTIAIGVVDTDFGNGFMTGGRVFHKAKMRWGLIGDTKAQFGDIDIILLIDKNIIGPADKIPAAQIVARGAKKLYPAVLPVGDINRTGAVHRNTMGQIELTRAATGFAPGKFQLSVRAEFMHPGIAIAIGDIQTALRSDRDIGDAVERLTGKQYR